MSMRSLILAASVLLVLGTDAQTVLPTSGDPLLLAGSASDLPSLQGMGFRQFAITLPTISGNASNSALNAGMLRDLVWGPSLSQAALDRIVQSDGEVAYLNLDAQLQAIGIAFHVRRADSTVLLSVGLEHRERQLTALRLDQELFQLLYYGNKPHVGRTLTLDPMELRNVTYRSLGGNVAFDLPLKGTAWRLRPAIGLSYLWALEGVHFEGDGASMYTGPDGRYVDITADYRMDVAVPEDLNPWKPQAGSGVATDIAVAGVWRDRLQLHLGVNDIGSLKMTGGLRNFSHVGTTRYEGVAVALNEYSSDPEVTWDTLVNPLDPLKTTEPFTMRLPTTLLVYAQYGMGMRYVKGMPFPRHLVWGNLRNALNDDHFNRSRLGGAVGYTYNLNDRFNAGTAFTMPGGGTFLIGLHATVRMGPVRMGVASRDLWWLTSTTTALSADARFMLQLAF